MAVLRRAREVKLEEGRADQKKNPDCVSLWLAPQHGDFCMDAHFFHCVVERRAPAAYSLQHRRRNNKQKVEKFQFRVERRTVQRGVFLTLQFSRCKEIVTLFFWTAESGLMI